MIIILVLRLRLLLEFYLGCLPWRTLGNLLFTKRLLKLLLSPFVMYIKLGQAYNNCVSNIEILLGPHHGQHLGNHFLHCTFHLYEVPTISRARTRFQSFCAAGSSLDQCFFLHGLSSHDPFLPSLPLTLHPRVSSVPRICEPRFRLFRNPDHRRLLCRTN